MSRYKKIALVGCSNGQSREMMIQLERLQGIFKKHEIEVVEGQYIFGKNSVFSGTGKEKAQELNKFYQDDTIDGIFDVSGGDLANEVLEYLDYDFIKKKRKMFWGYSDLTTVLNGIYTKTGCSGVWYQIRNLLYGYGDMQEKEFFAYNQKENDSLFRFSYEYIQGNHMEGTLVGGNIRCFLKLAGTPYFPDVEGKLLLLEAYGGNVAKMVTYLNQLKQMGVFQKVAGIVLGTFTEMEKNQETPPMEELILRYLEETLPVIKTKQIGHGYDAKAVMIGEKYIF